MYPQRESNSHLQNRNLTFYPLNYAGIFLKKLCKNNFFIVNCQKMFFVANGNQRTQSSDSLVR